MLPSFLGIGAHKSGSTWLHNVLDSHPAVYVPQSRKEIRYFDRFYHKGLDWYESFFPDDTSAYEAIGEVSPMYIAGENVPRRVKENVSNCKFIAILRNPITRAYSAVKSSVKTEEDFFKEIEKRPQVIENGYYSSQLKNWFSVFDRKRFCLLVFEEVMSDKEKALSEIGSFLNVDPEMFDQDVVHARANRSRTVPSKQLDRVLRDVRRRIQAYDLDIIIEWAKQLGVKKAYYALGEEPKDIGEEEWLFLKEQYDDEIEELEEVLGRSLDIWKDKPDNIT